MRILFIHQNFPGQFKHLAPALAKMPGNTVLALSLQHRQAQQWQGVSILPYTALRSSTPGIHPWLGDFESKTIRAESCFRAALQLRNTGFTPDLIIAHPGWGESLFLKEVWPEARLGLYCEFFYQARGADIGFDPEFPSADPEGDVCRIRLKNLNNILQMPLADAGVSPTHWQASTFPEPFRSRISVIHDGIDTRQIRPAPDISLTLNGSLKLTRQQEIITFVNRQLEPYRGYHQFMRALPELLQRRPQARILIVGGDGVSYGAAPANGQSWKEVFIREVRPAIPDRHWQRVHFLGNLPYPQFIGLLQLSRVHVYLTYPFVLSWSLLEAMSAGCCIVASNTAPLREAIQQDQTGRLVSFFDPAALAGEICTLLDQPEICQQLGQQARKFAREHYDLQEICLPRQLDWVRQLAD